MDQQEKMWVGAEWINSFSALFLLSTSTAEVLLSKAPNHQLLHDCPLLSMCVVTSHLPVCVCSLLWIGYMQRLISPQGWIKYLKIKINKSQCVIVPLVIVDPDIFIWRYWTPQSTSESCFWARLPAKRHGCNSKCCIVLYVFAQSNQEVNCALPLFDPVLQDGVQQGCCTQTLGKRL